ncbi:MAG TPA: hypothetical protein DCM86_03440, partial [Verrucomicrobiales bacterium]|nr:hypothetical protein [Verrucomicrobiales bacterium]
DGEEAFQLPAYEIVRVPLDWNSAKADAEARGGHLAVITSEAEWQKIQAVVGAALFQQEIWIGATDAAIEGQWHWVTGEPFSYQRWQGGQPDNLLNQDYLMMRPPGATWYDMGSTAVAAAYLLERENVFQTDPNNPDTDGDGLKDGDEARFYKTDPVRVDTDGDGLSDFEEIRRFHTNPLLADTDDDGLADGEELFRYHTDPLKQDSDGDGYSDLLEVTYGSDPTLASSVPGPQSRIFTAVEIEFDTKLGELYQMQVLADAGGWTNYGAKYVGTGQPISRLISTRTAPKQLWRVVISK